MRIYDYADLNVPMLARMFDRRCRGYEAVGYTILLPAKVDLLCANSRVAVELDGVQHLADPIAYRRDRKKDRLLQENGYVVLRFLAEDVGKELDLMLDAILGALRHRRPAVPAAETLQFVRRG